MARHTFMLDGDEDGNRFYAEYDSGYVSFSNRIVQDANSPFPERRFRMQRVAYLRANRILALADAIRAEMEKEELTDGG